MKKITPYLVLLFILAITTWINFRISIIVILFLLLSKLLHKILKSGAKNILKNISLALFGLFLILMLLEIVFMYVPQAHGVGFTKAAYIWRKYYWDKPRNSYGYRDVQVDLNDTVNKKEKLVYVLGDSFTEGQGIENFEDRYTNKLEKAIGKGYKVCNMGLSGTDTRNQFQRLSECRRKPDVLILQYYGNDIEVTASESGRKYELMEPYKKELDPVSRFVVGKSFLANYIYWQFPHFELNSYSNFLHEAYLDTGIMAKHLKDLDKFVVYSKQNNIPFVVVVFPYMVDIEGSDFYVKPIEAYLKDKSVDFIDVGQLIKDIPVKERMASKLDIHSSELVHDKVAVALYKKLKEEKLFQ